MDLAGDPARRYFVQDVEAGLVAQFQEPGRVVVVAGANGADVGRLQQRDVGLPAFFRQRVAVGRELLVAAGACELDGHAVDQHHAILQFDLAEADAVLDALDGAIAVRQAVKDIIQIRFFGRPELGGGYGSCERDRGGAVGADLAGLARRRQVDLRAVEEIQFTAQREMRAPARPATRTVDVSVASLYWASRSVTTVTSSTCRGGRATRYVSR